MELLKANKVSKYEEARNMHIIFESVLMLFTKNYQNLSMLVEITACQSWHVFLRHSVYDVHGRQGINVSLCEWQTWYLVYRLSFCLILFIIMRIDYQSCDPWFKHRKSRKPQSLFSLRYLAIFYFSALVFLLVWILSLLWLVLLRKIGMLHKVGFSSLSLSSLLYGADSC